VDIAFLASKGIHTEVIKIWDVVSHDHLNPFLEVVKEGRRRKDSNSRGRRSGSQIGNDF
jgi:hypothetical protein